MRAIFFNEPTENNFLGHIFGEVYKEQVYAPFLVGKKDLIIVDIGSNIGITTFYFSHFAKKVISVEPSKEHFEVLSQMVKYNELKNVTLINKAIYIKSGKFPLFHPENGNKTMYSLHAGVGVKDNEMVDAITFEELFKQEGIDHVDFLKVDIEGSETEVFSSSSFKNVADKIDTIVTERHEWSGRHPNQLLEALKNAGFQTGSIPSNADLIIARK